MTTEYSPETEAAIAGVETQMGVLVARMRALWKEGARSVHPDLQPVAYKLLSMVVRSGSCQAGNLAEQLATDKSVISRQVKLMEELGLLVSTPDPADGRARILTATPVAVEKITTIREANMSQFRERLSGWSEEELVQFATLLRRISG